MPTLTTPLIKEVIRMDEFFRSAYGRRYFEHQLPALIKELHNFTEATKLFLTALETSTPVMLGLSQALTDLEETIGKMSEEELTSDEPNRED
jgi:hypothetical protein